MKYFYVGVLLLALLLTGCWFSWQQVRRGTQAASLPLELAASAFEAGDEAGSRELARKAALEWQSREGVLASLLSHERSGKITLALEELAELRGREFLQSCRRLLRMLRELAELERVAWRNIF